MKTVYLFASALSAYCFFISVSTSLLPANRSFEVTSNLAFQIVSYDCNSGVLQYKITGGDGSPINLVLPGIFAGTVSAENVATHTFPGDARVGRTTTGYANQSGNQISITFITSCNLSLNNPGNPPTNPPANSPSGGSLAFQIVSYDCNSGLLQYQMNGGDGSPINLTLPGIFAGNVSAGSVATHTFPGDARTGRTVNGTATQSGNQISINFTTNCNLSNSNPNTNLPSNPNPGTNPLSGSNLSFQIVSYDCNSGVLQYKMTGGGSSPVNLTLPGIFAGTVSAGVVASHTFPGDARVGRTVNGTASKDGNQISINFTTSCNLTGSGSTPSSNPNSGNQPSTSNPAGSNFSGSFDEANCRYIRGWVMNRNTPYQSTKVDIYVNGWLVVRNALANQPRQDVANAFGISGYNSFGFVASIPRSFKLGSVLTISVKYAGTSTDIQGSPRLTEICPNMYISTTGGGDCGGQVARVFPGAEEAITTVIARTGATGLQLNAEKIKSLTSKLIPMYKDREISLHTYAFTPLSNAKNLAPQITKAVVGGAVIGMALSRQSALPDQRSSAQTLPTVGLGTALTIPLVKDVLANRLPKAGIELAFYDKNGKFIYRQVATINKPARKDWQLLQIRGRALQDGYIAMRIHNRNKIPVYFDDIKLKITSTRVLDKNNEMELNSRKFSSANGFVIQVDTEKNTYLTSADDDCEESTIDLGAIITLQEWANLTGGNWLDPVSVTAPAPSYGYSNGDVVPLPNTGGSGNGGGSSGGQGDLPRPTPVFTNEPLCCTLKRMWQASLDSNGQPKVEVMALATNLGTLVFPVSGLDCAGTYQTNSVSRSYTDIFGNYVIVTDVNGNMSTVLDLCDGRRVEVYGVYHTHPSTAVGNPFQPSPADIGWAASHPGTSTFILGQNGLMRYDGNGNTYPALSSQDLVNCTINCPQ
ncbi:hypothetical protein IC229_10815 [Spirosoma sp. BT702]|uniref:DUF4329 domain-containing protein n=1 Tax=Spirosoma profusum TaxID=2771354 RepID=A0A927AQS8_9BACT|nr:hypothetical protein [Spirosoma profusum]MBD2701128.1 hypothetical protein [Spirosoma profusum]